MGLITWLYCELKNTILIPENGYIQYFDCLNCSNLMLKNYNTKYKFLIICIWFQKDKLHVFNPK